MTIALIVFGIWIGLIVACVTIIHVGRTISEKREERRQRKHWQSTLDDIRSL